MAEDLTGASGTVREPLRGKLEPRKPIAIVRLDDLTEAVSIGRSLLTGGVDTLEFALTNGQALRAIEQVRELLGAEVLVGAGTVLDGQSAEAAILAGAQFLVSPIYQRDVVKCGRKHDVPVVCGAFSPTEIMTAWQSGADLVKVFPARGLGPEYIKDVLAPIPHLKLVPTGGINLDNCSSFLEAGAYTVALGSSLVDEAVVARCDWETLSKLAQQYAEVCRGGIVRCQTG